MQAEQPQARAAAPAIQDQAAVRPLLTQQPTRLTLAQQLLLLPDQSGQTQQAALSPQSQLAAEVSAGRRQEHAHCSQQQDLQQAQHSLQQAPLYRSLQGAQLHAWLLLQQQQQLLPRLAFQQVQAKCQKQVQTCCSL